MNAILQEHIKAPLEQFIRAHLKLLQQQSGAVMPRIKPVCHYGTTRILAPNLGEMGLEVRNSIARAEPYLRAGWKVMTRKPAFYPTGTAICDPDYFAEVDAIMKKLYVFSSAGGIHIPNQDGNSYLLSASKISETGFDVNIHCHGTRNLAMLQAETALRRHFLDWLYFEGRPLTEYDRWALSFSTTAAGNADYSLNEGLPPSFRPPAFENPPEPIPPHIGVQIRDQKNGLVQPRNSDPARMQAAADALAKHLKLDLVYYGLPDGCVLPPGQRHSWDPKRPQNFSQRELGYLKSCRLMLSANSGWVDLMAWLGIPVLLEKLLPGRENCFEPLRHGFAPKILTLERDRPIGELADLLLSATAPLLPQITERTRNRTHIFAEDFPWDI